MNYHEISSEFAGSYKQSGLLLAGIAALVSFFLFINGRPNIFLTLCALFLALLALSNSVCNQRIVVSFIWLGNVMHRVTNPFIFAVIYIIAVIPVALALKLTQKDVLKLKYDSECESYWIDVNGSNAPTKSFYNQY